MAPTIRIDDEVYSWLKSQAEAFEDTPNSVLRRIAELEDRPKGKNSTAPAISQQVSSNGDGGKTPQKAFRDPLLSLLKENNGEMRRAEALKALETKMDHVLNDFDRANIDSGMVRWEKSADWEVKVMREEGLLKPATEMLPGVWALTDYGWSVASEL